jgi:hypothetical protein
LLLFALQEWLRDLMSIKFEPLVGSGDITRELSPPPLSLAVLIAAGFGAYTGYGVSEPGDDGATAAADRNVSHGSQTLRG